MVGTSADARSAMLRAPFDVEVDFSAAGNALTYMMEGWCRSESQYTWSSGSGARLILPKPFDSDAYELTFEAWPFVVAEHVPVQHIEIIVRGVPVFAAQVGDNERRVIRCMIPPETVAGCANVDVVFRFPDAVAPNTVPNNSGDTRVLAFAFFWLHLSGRMAQDATMEQTKATIGVVTPEPADAGLLRLVDVGAMGGIQAKWHPYLERVAPVLFEPNPEEAARLRAQHPHAAVVEAALGNTVGPRNLMITENPTCVSLRPPNQEFVAAYGIHPHLRMVGAQEVMCTRYDVLHQAGTVPAPDAIKLDVQGCEYEVLLGFGALLQDCLGIEMEAHFYPVYREQKLLGDIIALLREYGFVLRKLDQNKMNNFDGDLVEVDAFFTKPRHVVRAYNATQRRKFDLLTEVWELAPYRL